MKMKGKMKQTRIRMSWEWGSRWRVSVNDTFQQLGQSVVSSWWPSPWYFSFGKSSNLLRSWIELGAMKPVLEVATINSITPWLGQLRYFVLRSMSWDQSVSPGLQNTTRARLEVFVAKTPECSVSVVGATECCVVYPCLRWGFKLRTLLTILATGYQRAIFWYF